MNERVTSSHSAFAAKEKGGGQASGTPDLERLREQLTRSVNRVCPPWLASFRDDIIQVAMVRVLEILEKREQDRPPPASYVWKVAYSTTVDQIRRIRRKREVAIEAVSPEDRAAEDGRDPFRDCAARELGAGIQGCLNRLAEKRRLVVGFHLLGHTLAEIETLLDWNAKKVRNLLYRGLADLRGCLVSKGLRP